VSKEKEEKSRRDEKTGWSSGLARRKKTPLSFGKKKAWQRKPMPAALRAAGEKRRIRIEIRK
jgi:hypothetical protein